MGIFDNFVFSSQEDGRDETEIKRTTFQDGPDTTVLGGKSRREIKDGERLFEEERDNLLMADDGVITSTDPLDQRYPHMMGKDYRGNLVSAGNLNRCREKGCDRMVSNMSGAEYKPRLWRCTKHYKKYEFRQFLKWCLALFYRFKDEDELPEIPVLREEPENGREER